MQYSDLGVSIYQEDGKYLDLFDIMNGQAVQSVIFTFVCMFFVTFLFIPQPVILLTATFTILSTTIGVFGVMSWMGEEMEPVFMCAMIMSIGFSVDIPAHIGFHFHHTIIHSTDIAERLQRTVSRVGFPIVQASVSTFFCVGSLLFVHLHMSSIFAYTMLLVVFIGTIHGLVVMPAIFALAHHIPGCWKEDEPCCGGSKPSTEANLSELDKSNIGDKKMESNQTSV